MLLINITENGSLPSLLGKGKVIVAPNTAFAKRQAFSPV
jgi:hypothetical protein